MGRFTDRFRPSRDSRAELLQVENRTLKISDESAWTIVNSRASFSTRDDSSRKSFESAELVYKPLDCENDLFTARVYKRNYRSTMIKSLFKPEKIRASENVSNVQMVPMSWVKDEKKPGITIALGETHQDHECVQVIIHEAFDDIYKELACLLAINVSHHNLIYVWD
jgi:hypothetical protein